MIGSKSSAAGKRALDSGNRSFLLKLGANEPLGIVITATVMLALACVVNVFNIPNPNMILVAGLVICCAVFGVAGGATAIIIMMASTLYTFSTGHDFVSFTDQSIQKVIVSAIGATVITLFVSYLRRVVTNALTQLEQLTEELEEDNQLLEAASAVDALTNVRNRFGLRRDFPNYLGTDVHVTMIDLDNFKDVNDTYGHQVGDLVLSEMGKRLAELCGQDHVYRYGGDEFLIICTETSHEEFPAKAESFKNRIADIAIEGIDIPIRFSAGYTYGRPETPSDLRLMIRQADSSLYDSKSAGKDRINGGGFSRMKAESLEIGCLGASGRTETLHQRNVAFESRPQMRMAI